MSRTPGTCTTRAGRCPTSNSAPASRPTSTPNGPTTCAGPRPTRASSAEPLLGPLPALELTYIDQLIIGGESGPGARPMDLGWVRELISNARQSGTAVFVKQLGTHWAGSGKGNNWNRWPDDLRIREFPGRSRHERHRGRAFARHRHGRALDGTQSPPGLHSHAGLAARPRPPRPRTERTP
jgi:hypothetical protein